MRKRVFDLVVIALAAVVALPVAAACALAVSFLGDEPVLGQHATRFGIRCEVLSVDGRRLALGGLAL